MGMFDELSVHVPLPVGDSETEWQTKSLGCDLDYYEIRDDGTLWHEAYDMVDRSDPTKPGLLGLMGCMSRENERWEPMSGFVGEIGFYSHLSESITETNATGWTEYSAYFVGGKLVSLNRILGVGKFEPVWSEVR